MAVTSSEQIRKPVAAWEWGVLACVLLLGAGLRFAYLVEIRQEPNYAHLLYDPQYHDYWARGLVTGDWTLPPGVNDPQIRSVPHGRPPGYPWFLAGVYWLFGVNYTAPRLVQMGFGLFNAVLMFFMGRALFGRVTALLAALFMATYWGFIYFEGQISYPSVAITLVLLLMLVLQHWRVHARVASALLAGMLLGAFALFRPNGLIFGPIIAAWMLWVAPRADETREQSDVGHASRSLPSIALLTAGAALLLAPAIVRNAAVAHDFVFLSSFGGLNFYVGNNPESNGTEPRIPELREIAGIDNWSCFDYPVIVRGLARKLERPDLKFSDASAYFYKRAFDYIRSQPGDFLVKTVRKALLFWGPREVTNDSMPELDKRTSRFLRLLPGFAVLLALAVTGLIALAANSQQGTARLWNPDVLLVLAFVLAYFVSVLPFFIAGRYRIAVVPFLLLVAAYAVASTVDAFVCKRAFKGAAFAVLAVLLSFLLSRNPTGYEASESTWHFRRALAYAAAGDAMKAVTAYRSALESGDADAAVYNNLARLYAQAGNTRAAEETLNEGLARFPDSADLLNCRGVVLLQEGDSEHAVEAFKRALKSYPNHVLALINLGDVHGRRKEWKVAASHFLRAAELAPENASAWNGLGFALANANDVSAAEEAYRRALEADPAFNTARINLADLLLAHERREEAARELANVLKVNPDDPYAHNRLGLILDQAGRTSEALKFYVRAAELKPDYAEPLNNLGYIMLRQNMIEDAIARLEEAVRLDPLLIQARINLGDAYMKSGRTQDALAQFDAALQFAPGDTAIQNRIQAALDATAAATP